MVSQCISLSPSRTVVESGQPEPLCEGRTHGCLLRPGEPVLLSESNQKHMLGLFDALEEKENASASGELLSFFPIQNFSLDPQHRSQTGSSSSSPKHQHSHEWPLPLHMVFCHCAKPPGGIGQPWHPLTHAHSQQDQLYPVPIQSRPMRAVTQELPASHPPWDFEGSGLRF